LVRKQIYPSVSYPKIIHPTSRCRSSFSTCSRIPLDHGT
jgi:hypothetical protein